MIALNKQDLTLVVVCGLTLLGACSGTAPHGRGVAAAPPAMDSLVSAEWLQQNLDDPDLVVIDATVVVESDAAGNLQVINGRTSYEAGHIPGAVFADLLGDLSDPGSEYQFSVPSPEAFAAAMGELGVGDNSRVVVYDTMGMSWAARVWWMLRWVGFDRAALLDGGLNAWTDAGGALSSEPVIRSAQALSINLRPELIANQDEVRASIGNESIRLIDALTSVHYRGEWSMYARPGHISGAENIPVTSLVDETGRFLPKEDLAEIVGGDRQARTIAYCGGGIAAAADAFALTRIGFTNVAVYDGSLEEWTADPDNPMEVDLEHFD